jgi:hypothetical protein
LSKLGALRDMPADHSNSEPQQVPSEAVVQLKSAVANVPEILKNQLQWRATSQGYQNFFEFGELHQAKCVTCV